MGGSTCQSHTPEFRVELSTTQKFGPDKTWSREIVADLVVVDASPTFDDCPQCPVRAGFGGRVAALGLNPQADSCVHTA